MTGSSAVVVSLGISILLLAGIHSPQAAEIKIASPSAYLNREGGSCFCDDSAGSYRYQQVFPASDFVALGGKPHWIVGFGPRADQSVTSPHTAHLPDNYVRLSTTERTPGNLRSAFDDNFGSDVVQFYRGPMTMVADVTGPGPGPKGYYRADFPEGVTPFLYDPSKGNLLFDFIAWQGESPKMLVDRVPSLQTLAGDSFSTQGALQSGAAIFQFTFVPVAAAPTQLIVNGGFESPDTPTYMDISAGQNTLAPWVVGLGSVQVGDAADNGVIFGPAFEKAQFLDLNGVGRGRLTQTFTTAPGLIYTVTFAYANNYYNAPSASASVRIFDGSGDRLYRTITHASSVAGNYDWTVFAAQFTALQNTTSLEFTSLTDNFSGIMLDAVQVFEGALEIDSITRVDNGPVVLEVRGFPNAAHRIQASSDLNAGSFIDLATVTADAAGLFRFEDTRTGLAGTSYRIVYP